MPVEHSYRTATKVPIRIKRLSLSGSLSAHDRQDGHGGIWTLFPKSVYHPTPYVVSQRLSLIHFIITIRLHVQIASMSSTIDSTFF